MSRATLDERADDAGVIEFPYVVGGTFPSPSTDVTWSEHAHATHQLIWNEYGASTATVAPRTWTITPTIGLWIPGGTLHSGWTPASTRQRSAQFDPASFPSISAGPSTVQISPLLGLLLDRLSLGELDDESRATTEAMVLDVIRPAPRELLLRVPESATVAPIVAAIRTNPADPTTLAQWADRLGISTRTITRIFIAETGLGFARWVTIARAQHAITLLAQGESLDEIAERTGFSSASAFGAAFRRSTGMTPGQFRAL